MKFVRLAAKLSDIVSLVTKVMERFHPDPQFLYRIPLWTAVERDILVRYRHEVSQVPSVSTLHHVRPVS